MNYNFSLFLNQKATDLSSCMITLTVCDDIIMLPSVQIMVPMK